MEITASKLQISSSAGGRRGDGDSGEIESLLNEVDGCMQSTKSDSEEKLKTECILFRRGHRCLQQARSARTAWDQLDELWSEKEDMKEPQKTCVIAAKAARPVRGLDTTVAMEHCLWRSDPEERERKKRCDAEDGKTPVYRDLVSGADARRMAVPAMSIQIWLWLNRCMYEMRDGVRRPTVVQVARES